MALLLLSRTCNAPILRISVLKQDSRKEIFRTFAPRHTLKKQARTPPTNRRIYKMASLLFSKVCNASALQIKSLKQIASIRIQIFRTCVDEKSADALHTRVSCRRILKKQAMTPPIDKSAECFKVPSLFSKAYNGLILRVNVLNQRPRMQIFRTFGVKLGALRTRITHKRILQEQVMAPAKSKEINKLVSLLFSKVSNALTLRLKILHGISPKHIIGTFVDKSKGTLHSSVARISKTNKPAEFYKVTSLFSKVYNGWLLRVKVLNQTPRMQIFRNFGHKLDALRTRISHNRILQEQVMAPAKTKEINKMGSLFSKVSNVLTLRLKMWQGISLKHIFGTFVAKSKGTLHSSVSRIPLKEQISKTNNKQINKMVSLLFSKVSNVLTLRLKMLQGISLKHIFGTFVAKSKGTLHSNVSRIVLKEQISKTNNKLVEGNKLASSLFGMIYNDFTLRLKVLKPVGREQIFGKLTYESPISALRTRRLRRPTNKRPNIDKGALTIGSVGIGTLFIYKLGLLNQPDNIKIYAYFGCSIAVAVASAMAALYSPVIMNILTRKGIMTQIINMLAIIGTGVAAHNIEYNPGFGPKQLAWLLYASVMGIMLTLILIGPIPRRAMHTTGVVVGLYVIAACAPTETLYDPINEALSIFTDILNIFIRITALFAKVANKNK